MSMKKHLGKMIGLIVLGTLVFAWLVKAPIASMYLTSMMKVPVSIGNISIWPTQLSIRSFKIKNPKQFSHRRALEVKKIQVDYQYKKITGNPTEIDRVELDDVFLTVQMSNPLGTENNWTAISQGMATKKEKKAGKSSGGETIVHKLVVNNLTVELIAMVGPSTITKYDHIEMDELSSKTGFPTDLIIQGLFKQVNLDQFIPGSFQDTGGFIKDTVSPLFNNF